MGYLELAKLAGVAVLVAGIFGAGYKTAYNIEENKIGKLTLAIEQANSKAAEVLAEQTKLVASAEETARILNTKLETTYEEHTATIDDYKQQLAAKRLRDPNNKARCHNTVSESAGAGSDPKDAVDGADISAELESLLRTESYRADQTAIEKNLLLAFIKDNNCGIKE